MKKITLEENIKKCFGQISKIKVLNVNLRENKMEDCFGLNLLFKDLYEHYKSSKIDLNQ